MADLRAPASQSIGVIGVPSQNANTGSMTTNGNSQSFAQDHWDRYAHLKCTEDAKNTLIEDILSRYDAVVRQCNSLVAEQNGQSTSPADANEYTPTYQQQTEYITYLQNLMDGNPFITAVLDGNSVLFRDEFIRSGLDGGRRAAVMLRDELTEWVPKNVEHPPSEFKIVVKVYADLKSLAGWFFKAGVIDQPSVLGDFARGFNTLYEFVDIGGCDANGRVVDQLKLSLHDYHCRQVIFGGIHTLLNANVEDERLRSRATLLQCTPSDPKASCKSASFPEIFRTTRITTDLANSTPRTATPVFASYSAIGNGQSSVLPSPNRTQTQSPASSIASGESPSAKKTWAKLAQSVAPLPQTNMVPRIATPTPTPTPTQKSHNKKGQRIDPPFDYDWDTLQRVKKIKMCNMHYLHPDGCKWPASKCNHRHDYEPTDAELKVLRCVSRETACHNGPNCDEIVCVYGHRCPFPAVPEGSMRGLGCVLGDKCRFPREMHGIKDSTPTRATNTSLR